MFQVSTGEQRWVVRQVVGDPEGNHDWAVEATVDLEASDEQGAPTQPLMTAGFVGFGLLLPFYAKALGEALERVGSATRAAWATGNPQEALANAVPYMQAFGHVVLAWIWLDVAQHALARDGAKALPATVGRLGAADFFFHYELPKIGAWLRVVETRDPTCATMPEEAF
jgi:hypothetical protein